MRNVKFRWNQVSSWQHRMAKGKNLTLVVCFLLPLKREIKNVWHLQPISSVWGPLIFLPVTLSKPGTQSASPTPAGKPSTLDLQGSPVKLYLKSMRNKGQILQYDKECPCVMSLAWLSLQSLKFFPPIFHTSSLLSQTQDNLKYLKFLNVTCHAPSEPSDILIPFYEFPINLFLHSDNSLLNIYWEPIDYVQSKEILLSWSLQDGRGERED